MKYPLPPSAATQREPRRNPGMESRSGMCSCACQSSNSSRTSGATSHQIVTAALPSMEHCFRRRDCTARALERRQWLSIWDLQAERQLGRQRAQKAGEVEPALAGEEAIAARLANDLLHVGRPLGPRVAELEVMQVLARHTCELGERVAGAEEMDRVDEQTAVRAAGASQNAQRLGDVRDVNPRHRLEIGAQSVSPGKLAEAPEALREPRLVGVGAV